MLQYRGPNCGKTVDIGLGDIASKDTQCSASVSNAQNNTLRMRSDPVTGLSTHPMVYLEPGSHEFWPTEKWSYHAAPKHDGAGLQILTTTPPNLGEVENPMTEYQTALPILRFNGLWGAYSRSNTPPPACRCTRNGHGPLAALSVGCCRPRRLTNISNDRKYWIVPSSFSLVGGQEISSVHFIDIGERWGSYPLGGISTHKSYFRKVGNRVGPGRRLLTSHYRLVSHVAGSTPGQAQPTHSRTARLLRWLVACGRLVQFLLQLQQLA